MTSTNPAPAAGGGPWAPLASRVFRALWIAQLASNVGSWMQTVGAQWLLIGHGAVAVTLVQVAAGLPVLLLALPAGAMADLVDRRKVLLTSQLGLAVLAGVLAALTIATHVSPAVLLGITFLMGCGAALSAPAWQAVQPSLVPRSQIAQASALGSISVNAARAVGPAIGGLVVAAAGAGWTFALNAVSFLGIAVVLVRWQPTDTAPRAEQEREQVRAALRAGGRYVRHAPAVRGVLYRAALFSPAAAAMWALLPIVAHQSLKLGSGGYGLLLGAVGIGAVLGATALPYARKRLGGDRVLTLSTAVYAVGLVVLATVHNAWAVAVVLLPVGIAWTGALSTLNSALQLILPNWVRARGLGFYLMIFQGGQAVGALLWGLVVTWTSLDTTLLIAAAVLLPGTIVSLWWPLRERDSDPGPTQFWPEPTLVLEPAPTDGPVLVVVEYTVEPENAPAFTAAMRHVERSRRRTGAITWGLYADAADPRRFIENFTVGSWSEHLAQHHSRYTGLDHEFEERARELVAEEPRVTHAMARTPVSRVE